MCMRVYNYELQVFFGGAWKSCGHYATERDAWRDSASVKGFGDKFRVVYDEFGYLSEN